MKKHIWKIASLALLLITIWNSVYMTKYKSDSTALAKSLAWVCGAEKQREDMVRKQYVAQQKRRLQACSPLSEDLLNNK